MKVKQCNPDKKTSVIFAGDSWKCTGLSLEDVQAMDFLFFYFFKIT